jgi:hypothetical protein
MRANSVITSMLSVAAVVGMAVWLAVEHQAWLRAGQEHTALEQQADEMTGLMAENERMSNLVAQANRPQSLPDDQSLELLRLRGEVGLLRRQTRELEAVRNENLQARGGGAAPTAGYWPRGSWAFAGYASPDAALQSYLWAANNGDTKVVRAGATGEELKQIDRELGGKSETEVSTSAKDDFANLKSVRVLNREVQADDTVVLTAVFEERTNTSTVKLLMKKIGNGWKFSGPAQYAR